MKSLGSFSHKSSRSLFIRQNRRITVRAQAKNHSSVNITLSRRQGLGLLSSLPFAATLLCPPSSTAITVEEVTPKIVPAGPLTPREQTFVDVFSRSNPAVVTVFDATLPGRAAISGPAAVEQPEGNGSGFVWDTQGHIVTNWHVLQNALSGNAGTLGNNAKIARVYILNADGYEQAFDGYLVGADRSRDLAVLKIDAPTSLLRPLPVGDSSALKIGQSVLVIGAPFGFTHSMTAGVISATGRGFQSAAGVTIDGGIQIDAAINPGNSGGPLIDTSGRIIGINTAIFTNTGTSVGLGFALPIEKAAKVVPQLIANGKVTRAALGITFATVPIMRALNVSEGVLVQQLDPNGPAAKAGLLATRRGLGGVIAGDVIVRVGDKKVRSSFDLAAILDAATVGESVQVEVLRGVGQGTQPERVTVNITYVAE